MYKNKKILAIVPARAGSKRIVNKNIKLLHGKPLISYTLEQAKKSETIDKIVVSSDGENILNITSSYNVTTLLRPESLAQDDTNSLAVVKHVLDKHQGYDILILLQPTSPFRGADVIDKCIKKLVDQNLDSVQTVSDVSENPRLMFVKKEGLYTFNDKESLFNNTGGKEYVIINGAVFATTVKSFFKNGFYGDKHDLVIMDPESSLDIDVQLDWMMAEKIAEKRFQKLSVKLKIEDKIIGENHPVFIIAEAGVNHNGVLEIAKKMVDAAVEAKVDAIKFQTAKTEDLVTKSARMADYQEKNIGKKESQFDMIKRLELQYQDFYEIKKYCDQKGIMFLSTPHTEGAADFLDQLMPAFKIASGDITNLPFLEKIAKKNKPVIISTGMSNIEEIEEAINLIKRYNQDLVVLHCTTQYPCPINEVNLKAMHTIKDKFSCIVGYSDHTTGIEISKMAVSMGANVIEKHFTLDKEMNGPDHKASLNPKELIELVKVLRNHDLCRNSVISNEILGNGIKEPTKDELEVSKLVRKSVVAVKDISSGTIITNELIALKRPGTGIQPKYIKEVLGKVAMNDIKSDSPITWDNLK